MNKLALALVLILVVAIGATLWFQSGSVIPEVEQLIKDGRYTTARKLVSRHIASHPDDSHAVQLLMTTMVNDPTYGDELSIDEVINVLDKIPDNAPEALISRLQQAELSLKELYELPRAEEYAKRAYNIAPDDWRTNEMMFNIYQLTRRFPVAEKYYDGMYENAPANRRLDVLRRWYASQFLPRMCTQEFDKEIKIDGRKDADMIRFMGFVKLDPEATGPRSAAASYYLDAGVAKDAVDLLTAEQVDRSRADDFYTHQLIRGYLMLGKLEEAEEEFKKWSFDKDTHLYNRTAAFVAEEIEGDYEKAISLYEEALKPWPGPVDIKFKQRYVSCLRKAKMPEKVKAVEQEIEDARKWTNRQLQIELRAALEKVPAPEAVAKLAAFYRLLDREGDAKRWEALLEQETTMSDTTPIPTQLDPANTDF